jgi:hypothetical protein
MRFFDAKRRQRRFSLFSTFPIIYFRLWLIKLSFAFFIIQLFNIPVFSYEYHPETLLINVRQFLPREVRNSDSIWYGVINGVRYYIKDRTLFTIQKDSQPIAKCFNVRSVLNNTWNKTNPVNKSIWTATDEGLCLVETTGDSVENVKRDKILEQNETYSDIEVDSNGTWLSIGKMLCRFSKKYLDSSMLFENNIEDIITTKQGVIVRTSVESQGKLFPQLTLIKNGNFVPGKPLQSESLLEPLEDNITTFNFDNTLWVVMLDYSAGVYKTYLLKDDNQFYEYFDSSLFEVSWYKDKYLFKTENGFYIGNANENPIHYFDLKSEGLDKDCHDFLTSKDNFFLTCTNKLFKLNPKIEKVSEFEKNIRYVFETNVGIFIITDDGLYLRTEGNNQLKLKDSSNANYSLVEYGNKVLIAYSYYNVKDDLNFTELYEYSDDKLKFLTPLGYGFSGFHIDNNQLYIIDFYKETYNIIGNVSIEAIIKYSPNNFLWEGSQQLTANYNWENQDFPQVDSSEAQFRVFLKESDDCNFILKDKDFSPINSFHSSPISWSLSKNICIVVRDLSGNEFRYLKTYTVLPWQSLFLIIPVLFCSIIALMIYFAPYWKLSQRWLLFFYSDGTSWKQYLFIPFKFILDFEFVKRHFLKRYVENVKNDSKFKLWLDKFVVPTEEFTVNNFISKLNENKVLILVGVSGIGKTSYFKYVTANLTNLSNRQKTKDFRNKIPVFIELVGYDGGIPFEQLVYAQLNNYGQMTNDKYNDHCIKDGGFLFLLDGLNEVANTSTHGKIKLFIDTHKNENFFCLSSQQLYSDFSNFSKIDFNPLQKETVQEILKSRMGNSAITLLQTFSEKEYKTLSNPQDLELALELMQNFPDLNIPKSRRELYSYTLKPFKDFWEESGQTQYYSQLTKCAFDMLITNTSLLKDLPDEIYNSLINKKFIIKRGTDYQFRHDLIKSFLASEHLKNQWRNILSNESDSILIDYNWLDLLKFVLDIIESSDDAKELTLTVLRKSQNKEMALDLFNWLEKNYPDKCNKWEHVFDQEYAKLIRKKKAK